MSIYVTPGASFETEALQGGPGTYFPTGGVGTVRVRVDDGQGATVVARATAGIVEDGVAIYVATITAPTTAGTYNVVWDDNAGNEADGGSVVVTYSAQVGTSIDLCTLADVKASLEITTTSTDALISDLITSASSALANRYQREFIGATGGTRYFGMRERLLDLAPYDLRAVTALTLHPEQQAQPLTEDLDFVLLPQGMTPLGDTYSMLRLSNRLNFTSTVAREFGEARVRIVGNWGCFAATGAVPDDLRRGAVVTVSTWLDRAIAEYAISGEFEGREMRPDRSSTWAIPNAAHAIFHPWERIGTL